MQRLAHMTLLREWHEAYMVRKTIWQSLEGLMHQPEAQAQNRAEVTLQVSSRHDHVPIIAAAPISRGHEENRHLKCTKPTAALNPWEYTSKCER